jgi:hypothetical protein
MQQTVEQAVEACKRLQALADGRDRRQYTVIDRLTKEATLWQGKFRIVAHENNVLRRKLRRRDE